MKIYMWCSEHDALKLIAFRQHGLGLVIDIIEGPDLKQRRILLVGDDVVDIAFTVAAMAYGCRGAMAQTFSVQSRTHYDDVDMVFVSALLNGSHFGVGQIPAIGQGGVAGALGVFGGGFLQIIDNDGTEFPGDSELDGFFN